METPGDYESVRQLLGHRSLATTVEHYTGVERAANLRRYDALIEGLRAARAPAGRGGHGHDLPALSHSAAAWNTWPAADRHGLEQARCPGDVVDEGGPAATGANAPRPRCA